MKASRLVLDTNVVLSALVFPTEGSACVRRAWQQGILVPVASAATVEELVRALAYPKFRLAPMERHDLLADYLPYTRAVRLPDPPPAVPVCRDPFDVAFVQLALVGRADMLVSGDRDLLSMKGRFRIPICSLADLVRIIAD